jgi:hypothetical protein
VKRRRCVIERGEVMLDSGSRDKEMNRKNRVKISLLKKGLKYQRGKYRVARQRSPMA